MRSGYAASLSRVTFEKETSAIRGNANSLQKLRFNSRKYSLCSTFKGRCKERSEGDMVSISRGRYGTLMYHFVPKLPLGKH